VVIIIHQALGGVLDLEAVLLPAAEVDDALVAIRPALPR